MSEKDKDHEDVELASSPCSIRDVDPAYMGLEGSRTTQGHSKMTAPGDLTPEEQQKLEAAAFRRLVSHLRERTDVQNIDLMITADFCRNCLSNWYQEAAEAEGIALDKEAARERVYGMPYGEWKANHQTEATPEQMAAFEARRKS